MEPLGIARVPAGQTARRLTWRFLPGELREAIAERLGSPVEAAVSQDSGFTPGFASLVTAESGETTFVKAANRTAQRPFADAYATEAARLRSLDGIVPAPRLLFEFEAVGWIVLGIEAVEADLPRRPWVADQFARSLALTTEIAAATTRLPDGPPGTTLAPVTEEEPDFLEGWQQVDSGWPHRREAQALARAFGDLPMDHLAHADLRDDNILLCVDGRTLACDWNWPALAPGWFDSLGLLISAYGDGLDAASLTARHPLTADSSPEEIDAGLAAICGFMMAARQRPVPPTSPFLRVHQHWFAEASWAWLSERRGWS